MVALRALSIRRCGSPAMVGSGWARPAATSRWRCSKKEARLSRDFVEGIAKSQGLTEVETQKVELEAVVTQSLQDLRTVFTKNEIHLEERFVVNDVEHRTRLDVVPRRLGAGIAVRSAHFDGYQAKNLMNS